MIIFEFNRCINTLDLWKNCLMTRALGTKETSAQRVKSNLRKEDEEGEIPLLVSKATGWKPRPDS